MSKIVGFVAIANVTLAVRLTSGQADPTAKVFAQRVDIQAIKPGSASNTGPIYLGKVGIDKTTGAQQVARVQPEGGWSILPGTDETHVNLADYYIMGDNVNDAVLVTLVGFTAGVGL